MNVDSVVRSLYVTFVTIAIVCGILLIIGGGGVFIIDGLLDNEPDDYEQTYDYTLVGGSDNVEHIPYSSLDDGEKELVDEVISSGGSVTIDSFENVPVNGYRQHTVIMDDRTSYTLAVEYPGRYRSYGDVPLRFMMYGFGLFGLVFGVSRLKSWMR